jgi:hypothetical protein
MNEDEKEAARRRAAHILNAVLHVTEAKRDLMQVALDIAKGDHDAEEVYNKLLDIEQRLTFKLAYDTDLLICLLHDQQRGNRSEYEYSRWIDAMKSRRNKRIREQRKENT